MAFSKARRAANERYNSAHYDQISVRLPAGRKDLVEDVAINLNKTMNRFINESIAAAMNIPFDTWTNTDIAMTASAHVSAENSCPIVFRAPPELLPMVNKISNHYNMSPDKFMVSAITFACQDCEQYIAKQQNQQGNGAEEACNIEE